MNRHCCPFDWSSIMLATCADGNSEYYLCVNRPTKFKKQRSQNLVPVNQNHRGLQSSRNEHVAGASSTEVATQAAASQSNAIKALSQAAEQPT